MGFHGFQLLGLGMIGFGIYVELQSAGVEHTNFFPGIGVALAILGIALDPLAEKLIKKLG